MGVSAFTDHLIEALGISRVTISSAYMIGTLVSSLLTPFAGMFLDRRGARTTGAIATVLLSLFLVFLAYSGQIASCLASVVAIPAVIIAFVVTAFGFLGIRFFGQGVITIVSRTMVSKWFGPRRGLVVGLMGVVTAFGFSYAPQPLHSLIGRWGWMGALFILALLLIGIFLPIVIVFFRSDPESCGMTVEQGMAPLSLAQQQRQIDSEREFTVGEARKQLRFWIMAIALGYWTLFGTAFTFHIIAIYGEIGVEAADAVKIFLPISFISVAAQFIGSWASDRLPIKAIFLAFGVAMLTSSASLAILGTRFGDTALLVSYGVANGMFSMLSVVTWPKLFGRKHLGAISGFAMSILVAGSAIGPWLFSIGSTFTGSYKIMGYAGATACLILVCIMACLRFVDPDQSPST
jgi:MFS family permease